MLESAAHIAIIAVAFSYLFGKFREATRNYVGRRLREITQRAYDRIDDIKESMRPSFDLWWEETGEQQVLSKLSGQIEYLPPPFQEMAKMQAFNNARGNGIVLAALLNVGNPLKEFEQSKLIQFADYEGKIREDALEKYDRQLDELRADLIDMGIDLPEFEKRFAPVAA